jgi:predicted lipid-binding transport protein (Tim44 family)
MKRLVIAAFAAVVGLSMMTVTTDAEAKRLGGGGSVGMSRNTTPMKQATPPAKQATPAPAATPAAAAPASGMSRWMGPLAGLAAGLGIAALMSHFGMGEAMGNFLMIALAIGAVMLVIGFIMRKKAAAAAPGMQYAGGSNAGSTRPFERTEPASAQVSQFEGASTGGGAAAAPVAATSAGTRNIPADFDVDGFVRQAKLNFIRLQAANDRGDMDDIREFTAPELFAEIQMQYQERGKSKQETDVVVLNAELLDVSTEGNRHVASVQFHGQIREEANAAPAAFEEIWHLAKPIDGSRGWLVAGIQQG